MPARSSTDDATPPSIEKIVEFWKRNGLTHAVAIQYQQWVRGFMLDCAHRNLPPFSHLTAAEVKEFAKRHARRKRLNRHKTQRRASAALHAWSIALAGMGMQTASWSEPRGSARALSPLLTEYVLFRRLHANAADSSIKQEVRLISDWLEHLRSRRRPFKAIHLKDVDTYLLKIRRRYAVGTVGTILSALRLFLRFLRTTGRLRHDLASSVQGPPGRRAGPPRALPWPEVQRLLRAVDRGTRPGLRDYAMLLLMSLYGLGSAEVIGLKLADVHWRGNTLSVRRPKTRVDIELPLLPAAARALAGYLRRERPPDAPSGSMFVCHHMPHVAFTSSTIRYVVRKYATKAGIQTRPLGAHVLRHSFAARQVDQQVAPRVLSSILGHRDPESTSVYTRVAIERLRGIALPVPR